VIACRGVAIRPLRQLRAALVVCVVGVVAVFVWGLIIRSHPAITAWDQNLLVAVNGGHSGFLDAATQVFNYGFSPVWSPLVVVAVAAVIVIATRRLGTGIFVALTAGVIYAPVNLIKVIVQRPRPLELPYVVPGPPVGHSFSFPSGHVTMAAAVVLVLVLVVRQRRVAGIVGGLVVAATAFSRMYAGAHYLIDVLTSMVYVATAGPAIYAGMRWLATRGDVVARIDRWAERKPPPASE